MQMNQAQEQAVSHLDGPMLVLAGPGSGKTLVITERSRYLIEHCHIPEEEILVITFTKAAAKEMKERFLALRKTNSTRVNFGTFHAVFFTILKQAYRLSSANVVGEEQRFQYIKDIIHRMELEFEDEKEFVLDLLSEISMVKGSRIDLDNYYSMQCSDEVFRRVYKEYNNKLRRANLIDFDDMLLYCHQLLIERKDILGLWQNKFRYILIDEFQDINMVQYDIIKMLAYPQNNLFVVGDDDQSIYRFRGAKPEIMLNFPTDYPNCKQIVLNINYRSTGHILGSSNRLISRNAYRFQKESIAAKAEGSAVAIRNFETLGEQNQTVAQEIINLQSKGIPVSDMAVLVRTNMGAGALLHKLMEYNIPFLMKDNLPNLFDHWITADLMAYMKIAMGSSARSLFLQIINRPKRYISRESFDSSEVDLEDVKAYYEDKEWMLSRIEQLEYDLSLLSRMGPYAAINYIRRGVGYEDYLREYAEQRRLKAEELFDILDELQESARGFKTYEEWFSHMDNYKEELKKQAQELKSSKADAVTIATMHSSKGLEFYAVFIVDANEGITPHKKAVQAEDLEEERRLFYVAMTRAKEALYIFSTKERYNKVMQHSRFIDDINEKKS